MKRRNPSDPQRQTIANRERTLKVLEKYHGKVAILNTWESSPIELQIKFHDDIIALRARVRNIKNYLLHRADANISI